MYESSIARGEGDLVTRNGSFPDMEPSEGPLPAKPGDRRAYTFQTGRETPQTVAGGYDAQTVRTSSGSSRTHGYADRVVGDTQPNSACQETFSPPYYVTNLSAALGQLTPLSDLQSRASGSGETSAPSAQPSRPVKSAVHPDPGPALDRSSACVGAPLKSIGSERDDTAKPKSNGLGCEGVISADPSDSASCTPQALRCETNVGTANVGASICSSPYTSLDEQRVPTMPLVSAVCCAALNPVDADKSSNLQRAADDDTRRLCMCSRVCFHEVFGEENLCDFCNAGAAWMAGNEWVRVRRRGHGPRQAVLHGLLRRRARRRRVRR